MGLLADDLNRGVGRSIVDHDDLDIGKALLPGRKYGPLDIGLRIEGGDYDRGNWHVWGLSQDYGVQQRIRDSMIAASKLSRAPGVKFLPERTSFASNG